MTEAAHARSARLISARARALVSRSRSRSGCLLSRPSAVPAGKHLILTEIAILGAVRALARSDPWLCRHHLARPRGVLRLRRLYGGPARQIRHHQRAGARAARLGRGRGGARLRHELPGAARLRPDPADGDARRRADAARDSPTASPASPAAPTACRASRSRRCFGRFRFDMFGHNGLHLLPGRAVHLFRDRAAHRLFAVRPVAALDQGQSAARLRDRHSGQRPAGRDLHGRGRLCRHRRRAADADDRLRFARRVLASSAPPTCCWC